MKKLKSLSLVFLLCIAGHPQGFAQDKVQGIIVELSTGEKLEYRLSDTPKMVYDGQTITLTANGVNVVYTPSELVKVRMGEVDDVSSGIEEQVSQQGEVKVEAGYVRLSGFAHGEIVRVYSMDGKLYANYQTSSDGALLIPISTLPSGISIIKVKQQTIKISKK